MTAPTETKASGPGHFLHRLRDVPAKDLDLTVGAGLTIAVRIGSYGLVAVAGIVVARALGAHDRGVYSLATTIALMFAALAELGISKAGIYFLGKKRFSRQEIVSNNLAWLLAVSSIWVAVILAIAAVRPPFVPDQLQLQHFLIFAAGGALLLFLVVAEDLLLASGSVLSYNLIRFVDPFLRMVLVVLGVVAFGFGIVGVLAAWLAAIAVTAAVAAVLLARRARLVPRIRLDALRAQLVYGLKGHLGFVLQVTNHRLDVFLVAAIAGTTALGHYAVAFGLAELLWRLPFALGAVFFPKASALDADENAATAAITCRRALFLVLLGVLAILPLGRVLIGGLYGPDFLPGLTAFYILAPSALFYTIFRVLSASLAGRGMPEVGVYAGGASVPVTIGLGLLLIPRMGIEGAAIASMAAYITAAAVALGLFVRVTGKSLLETLVITKDDVQSSVQAARSLLARGGA